MYLTFSVTTFLHNKIYKQKNVIKYLLNFQDLSSISIGSPIAAYFEDNTWYRAMVVGINTETVKVLYVDYGNRSDVSKLFLNIEIYLILCFIQ